MCVEHSESVNLAFINRFPQFPLFHALFHTHFKWVQ
jgi:hypothetical protein